MSDWTTLFDRPGFQSRLAKRFNLSRQTVNGWRHGIPIAYCAGVEAECNAEFTRRDFRPNDWREIWPELERRGDSATCKPTDAPAPEGVPAGPGA